MKEIENTSYCCCPECQGRGTKSRKLRKKVRHDYQLAWDQFEKGNRVGIAPIPPKPIVQACLNCKGSGLIPSILPPKPKHDVYPHIAIVGAGIGGVALAVACMHRGIPFTLYERDLAFSARSQGYGLTLQQASKAIDGLGIFSLAEGVVSTKHIVYDTQGMVLGEWGMRKWMPTAIHLVPKRTNIHIARQALRLAILKQLSGFEAVQWGHQLVGYTSSSNGTMHLRFEVDGVIKETKADLVVGADGIRSAVRRFAIGEEISPLRYLDCMVILGICPLAQLKELQSPLLDSATVFQTANGRERIYIMPFSADAVMWQLSFPMHEEDAKNLRAKGCQALQEEACRRTDWHAPIPEIIAATPEGQISGYPVYDRELLQPELLHMAGAMTLIGDAAHPMSPFKGQGANQAILDALSLARNIALKCASSHWRNQGLRQVVLAEYEKEMMARSATKVKDSAQAAKLLHSEAVLAKRDTPRGSCATGDSSR